MLLLATYRIGDTMEEKELDIEERVWVEMFIGQYTFCEDCYQSEELLMNTSYLFNRKIKSKMSIYYYKKTILFFLWHYSIIH